MTNSRNNFVDVLAVKYGVKKTSLLIKFLEFKTRAVDGTSKSRRNWAAVYTISVICEDFAAGNSSGSSSTSLLRRIKQKPYGSKLQNHHLDNRLNGEFHNKYKTKLNIMEIDGSNRKVSTEVLSQLGDDPMIVAKFVVDVVATYASIIAKIENEFLEEISLVKTKEEILNTTIKAFDDNADARLFEVVSFSILYLIFKRINVSLSINGSESEITPLTLYKTGRTNANDGGIDFVLKPIGKFFQVTETLDFKKYFLDFEKINRFPLSFVIKTNLKVEEVREKIKTAASLEMDSSTVDRYMSLFDEIYTLNELNHYLQEISEDSDLIEQLKCTIINCYQLEYGLLD